MHLKRKNVSFVVGMLQNVSVENSVPWSRQVEFDDDSRDTDHIDSYNFVYKKSTAFVL